MKTGISKKNIISYRTSSNKGKERGFLSFEGAVSPASIFLNYYLNMKGSNLDINTFIENSIKKWNAFFEEKFKDTSIISMFDNGNIVNIFTGDYTQCAAVDFESKVIESGIVNCILHEKKNFSHGRFINYENLNNKSNIYFKSNNVSLYEKELLNYLSRDNMLIIESEYNGILCEYDLLIASQFNISHW